MNLLRHAVSKQKRRFVDKESGLDLDLSYITPSLIAMGYPSKSIEAFYRNPMSDVERFLDSHHYGAYKVYNLCSERSYSDQRFHGRVVTQFPFPDHSPPPFDYIHPFCEDVSDWLHTVNGNVVAIHCKAGKGRTGVMICSFLVHCGATAKEAIKLYGEKRTFDGCGVTIPSQIRYIHYYERFLESRSLDYDPQRLGLQEIVINTIPKPLLGLEQGSNFLILTIMARDKKIYESLPEHSHLDHKLQQIRISIPASVDLAGDVKMTLWYDSNYKRCHLCHFHFNTTFVNMSQDSLHLKKSEVDKACKDKLHTIFDKDFSITVKLSPHSASSHPNSDLLSPNLLQQDQRDRTIKLTYQNHEGPDGVQISPPFFSTLKLASRSSARAIFNLGGLGTGSTTSLTGATSSSASTSALASVSTTPTSTATSTTSYLSSLARANSVSQVQTTLSPPPPPSSSSSTSSSWSSTPPTSQGNGKLTPPSSHGNGKLTPPSSHGNGKSVPFKPVWSDRDRDKDDNWDTASISSDCSELDSSLEWWYTKPPRATHSTTTITTTTSTTANIIQPENALQPTDPESGAVLVGSSQYPYPTQQERPRVSQENHLEISSTTLSAAIGTTASSALAVLSPLSISTAFGAGYLYSRGPLTNQSTASLAGGSASTAVLSHDEAGTAGPSGLHAAPSSAYKSPLHSATSPSPLAREIKFEREMAPYRVEGLLPPGKRENSWDLSEGSQVPVDELGQPYTHDKVDHEGVLGHDHHEHRDGQSQEERECHDREWGWADSVSKWLWIPTLTTTAAPTVSGMGKD